MIHKWTRLLSSKELLRMQGDKNFNNFTAENRNDIIKEVARRRTRNTKRSNLKSPL